MLTWFKESCRADELVKARMELIEGELPRFVATIHQELAASRDVLRILENYKKHAGLTLVGAGCADSGYAFLLYEAALIRFEARMGSAIISDIVPGLIGILRGDDGRMYLQMLSHDLKALELQRLKAKAAKIPPKIRVFSFIMLMCFMMTYIVIIVYQIVNSLWEACSKGGRHEKNTETALRRRLYRCMRPGGVRHAGAGAGGSCASVYIPNSSWTPMRWSWCARRDRRPGWHGDHPPGGGAYRQHRA